MAAHLAEQLARTNRLTFGNFNDHFSTLPPGMATVFILLFVAIVLSSWMKVVYVISGEAKT